MEKDTYYKQAIDFLTSNELNEKLNWKDVCISIAKEYPHVFIEIVSFEIKKRGIFLEDVNFVQKVCSTSNKIEAIKFVRNEKNLSLIDAKNLVEEIWEREGKVNKNS